MLEQVRLFLVMSASMVPAVMAVSTMVAVPAVVAVVATRMVR